MMMLVNSNKDEHDTAEAYDEDYVYNDDNNDKDDDNAEEETMIFSEKSG
jgi:hypothetical protein